MSTAQASGAVAISRLELPFLAKETRI